MIGLFLPRQRVVCLMCRQHIFSAGYHIRLTQQLAGTCRNGPLALICNNEQEGGDDVSARR
jgi:hypothetical protein